MKQRKQINNFYFLKSSSSGDELWTETWGRFDDLEISRIHYLLFTASIEEARYLIEESLALY